MPEDIKEHASIIFTDLVGYSAITQKGETNALNLLRIHHEKMSPIIYSHNGEIVKTIGDSLMIKFSKINDAVDCAIAMQQELSDHNLTVPKKDRMRMRVGIHEGKVRKRDNDYFGDVVNIASRIEAHSLPDQICISKDVYNQVRDNKTVSFKNIGNKKLKNIDDPIHLYLINPHKLPSRVKQLKWPFLIISFIIVYKVAKNYVPQFVDPFFPKLKHSKQNQSKKTEDITFNQVEEIFYRYKTNIKEPNENIEYRYKELVTLHKETKNAQIFQTRAKEFKSIVNEELKFVESR